ncbi:MAG: hypothetical protein ATN34_01005 [Epulopiscium sp. Nele67-Bin002]|nr:MAG: hypothetical protein BEN18_02430 [Epulopiscium sp. Nuni2H_MBin001]OON91406.1 MAG: hypothetical protein ATN34_01005 [Epulopiscium sp. Nele67-Bin002]OON93968.1 MAG: hypothetical protein ATN33_05030 [Epulopiscium sp. Nele67-Bin001]
MDTIIWIVSQHNVYINDYYNGEWKSLSFNKKDFYEIYCHHDVNELIDYLNYPLHYNNFKGSQLKIIYDMPIIYEYLYKVQHRFNQAQGLTLGPLIPVLLWYAYNKEIPNGTIIGIEGAFYLLEDMTLIEIEEEEDMEYTTISVKDCAKMLLEESEKLDEAPFNDETKEHLRTILSTNTNGTIGVFDVCYVLSPATIRVQPQDASKFLDVNDVLVHNSLVKDGTCVKKGDVLFEYTHEVTKWFGKKQLSTIPKISESDGIINFIPRAVIGDVWANKEDVLATIKPYDN